jgi:hypothetical protein
MPAITNNPYLTLVSSFVLLSFATWVGVWLRAHRGIFTDGTVVELGTVLTSAVTLLGLIIGFTFSMALGRYDQRKNYEEAEANAIGTEFVRADLLTSTDAAHVKALLRDYLDQRVAFYGAREEARVRAIDARTARLQTELWKAVAVPAATQPSLVAVVAVTGMNDVLNSQGYSQAAWWNRIPIAAWALMGTIGFCCSALVGLSTTNARSAPGLLFVVPLVLAIAFALVADLDSPRGGIIRVSPDNLIALATSLRGQ